MELEQKYGVDRGSFILKMSLSSDSETELDKQPQNEAEYQYEINKQVMNETDAVVINEPTQVIVGNGSKIFMENEPEVGNCSHDFSFKSKSKRKKSYHWTRKRGNWGCREDIALVSAVRDCVNCHFDGVKSATSALAFSKYSKFWSEVQKKLNAETGNCNSSQCVNRIFNALRTRWYYCQKRKKQQLDPNEIELFNILKELFGNGRKQRSEMSKTAKESPANDDESLSIKRAKRSGIDQILFASILRDGLCHGLNDMNSGKNVTCYKTHKESWDEVAKTLQEKTGKSLSPLQVLQKFRNLRAKLMIKKQNKTLSEHDEQVLGILEQVYSHKEEPKLGLHDSPISEGKEVSIDNTMSTEKKSTQSTCTPDDPDLFGYELRDRNKTMKGTLKPNTKISSETSPRQGSKRICLRSGRNEGEMQLRARLSFVKPLTKGNKQSKKQNSDLSFHKEENYNVDSLPTLACNKRMKRGVKEGLEPKDEICIANAVRDDMNCDMGGLKSARDAMSFRAHEGFWEELNRKFNEEMGKHTSAYELFQVFRSSKYKYLNSKRSLIHELSQHDEELFSVLEQVFSKDKKHRTGLSGTQLLDADGKQSWALCLGNQVEKLHGQSGAPTEHSPERRIAVYQDNQTLKDLSSHLLVSADKEEESSPHFLKTANPSLPTISPGDVLCQSGKREATLSAPFKDCVENPDGMKDTRNMKYKFKRPNEQADLDLEHRKAINQENQTLEELPCQVPLSSDGSTGVETQHQKEERSHLNVLNGFDLSLPSVSFRDSLPCGKTKASSSDPVNHGMKNLDVLKDTENIEDRCKTLDGAHTMLDEIVEECIQDPQNMTFFSGGRNKHSNIEELLSGRTLNGSKALEDVSCHENGYTEIVKRLEWKSRKLQLMQELYKIEQLEVDDRIRQAKLKASHGNP